MVPLILPDRITGKSQSEHAKYHCYTLAKIKKNAYFYTTEYGIENHYTVIFHSYTDTRRHKRAFF